MEDFDFTLPEDDHNKRRAYRTSIPGLEAWVRERSRAYAIRDLSALGMGIKDDSSEGFVQEDLFECDLLLNKKLLISGLKARVKRINADRTVGCNFEALDARREARLDKLILEVQKKRIALKRRAESNQDKQG